MQVFFVFFIKKSKSGFYIDLKKKHTDFTDLC